MPMYQRVFSVSDVGAIHRLFHEAIRTAELIELEQRRQGGPSRAGATRAQLLRAYGDFNDELDALAKRTATQAQNAMRKRLKATQVRSNRGVSPKLSTLLRARPLNRFGGIATGEVGVGDEDYLDRAINPFSPQYGPFWRAQEFGTGTPEVPSQLGRVIRGFFFKGGMSDPSPPQSIYAGGGGPHPIFVSAAGQRSLYGGLGFSGGAGPRGGVGGYGTIGKEIEGRHFIRDGADAALVDWRAGLRSVEQRAIASLQGLTRPTPRLSGRGSRRRRP